MIILNHPLCDKTMGGSNHGYILHLVFLKRIPTLLVKIFMFGDIDLDIVDNNGNTILHLIVKYYNKDEQFYENILKLFLKHGANPNILNQEQFTPLHLCVKIGLEKSL